MSCLPFGMHIVRLSKSTNNWCNCSTDRLGMVTPVFIVRLDVPDSVSRFFVIILRGNKAILICRATVVIPTRSNS